MSGPFVRNVSAWAGFALVLNLAWEIAQLPLYTLSSSGTSREIAFAIVHCTVGDVLIAIACFAVAAVATRRADWPVTQPLTGGVVAMLFGLGYTAVSEWWNVYQAGSWSYAPAMPLLFGIGLAPLLQWVVIPPLGIAWLRRRKVAP